MVHVFADPNRNVAYTFRNRIPVSLTQVASPLLAKYRIKPQVGLYAQDQWTIHRLTLNAGVRFDSLNVYIPAMTRPGGEFVPPISFNEVNGVPDWKDVTPRLGAAYDVFGNGKTAVKAAIGKYVSPDGSTIALATSPAATIVSSTARTWGDSTFGAGDPRTGNFVPDCDLRNPLANGECGAMANNAFGTSVVRTRYADDVLSGWGVRPSFRICPESRSRPRARSRTGKLRPRSGATSRHAPPLRDRARLRFPLRSSSRTRDARTG